MPALISILCFIFIIFPQIYAEARRPTRHLASGAQPLPLTTYPSLDDRSLLVDQDHDRLSLEEGAHRHELVLSPKCSLMLFFSEKLAKEDALGEKIPDECRGAHNAWHKSHREVLEEKLIAPNAKVEIDKDEDFDDTQTGSIRIDADGLAWLYELEPATKVNVAETYVVVENRGDKYFLFDKTKPKTEQSAARWKKSLLPQYSEEKSLAKYRNRIGRSLASEEPIIEGAPNSDAPAEKTKPAVESSEAPAGK
jgi:hypothetical protein